MDSFSLTYFPTQKVSYKEKDDEWRHSCVDGVISICYTYGRTRRQTSRNKRRNYNLFNNKIDKADFDYVLNPFNLSKEKLKEFNYPASLQAYDIVSPYFHLLLGEEAKRLFNPIVIAVNDEAKNEKEEIKKKEILGVLEMMLSSAVNPEQQDPNNPPPPPEMLQKYSNYTPKTMRESSASKLLTHFLKHENMDMMFNACFKDALIAGEEAISVERIGNTVKCRRVNPLELWYQLRNNSEILDDAEKIYERNQMTVSEIVDEFYEYLTPEQIDELESWGQGANSLYNFGDQQFSIPEVDSIYAFEDSWNQRGIPVHRVRWISKKKVGIHHFEDESGVEQEEVVEETFKLNTKDKTQWIEWFWVNEYWEGVRIGQDMYLDPLIRPRRQQFRSMDNMSLCKSGYFGTVYSATNAQSVSLMDRIVPWVYLYLIIWYRTELAMAKNIGRLGLIDISLIPDTWEPEKWMYYASAMGFGFVNSYNESNRTTGGSTLNQSTQTKALDLENFQYINGHIQMLSFIEERIQNTTGVTRQRMGEISSSELVGNTERAVTQSSHITEPYFVPHDYFKIRVCEGIIEVAKECLDGKSKTFQYITDDMSTIMFTVDGDDFVQADYGVFVSNATKDQAKLQQMKSLLQAALQNDKVQLSSVIDVLNSDSLSDIKESLLRAEDQQMQNMQQQQQAKIQADQEAQDKAHQLALEKMDRDSQEKQLDREKDIQIATIKSEGQAEMQTGAQGVKQLSEQSKLELERSRLEHEKVIQQRKLDLEQQRIHAEDRRTSADMAMQKADHEHEKKLNKEDNATKLRVIKGKNKPKK